MCEEHAFQIHLKQGASYIKEFFRKQDIDSSLNTFYKWKPQFLFFFWTFALTKMASRGHCVTEQKQRPEKFGIKQLAKRLISIAQSSA